MQIPFMQIGDLHIAAPFKGLPSFIARQRRQDIIDALKTVLKMAKDQHIPLLFITGDLFENEYITRPIIAYISRSFASATETRIFISPGNHDYVHSKSFYINWPWPPNVHIFTTPSIERIDLLDIPISVYGFGWDKPEIYDNCIDMGRIDTSRINVAVIHGDALMQSSSSPYLPIAMQQMIGWRMDYVALGHIHRPYAFHASGRIQPLDAANSTTDILAAYAGSIEPLDSSEIGYHGIISGHLNKNAACIDLIPIAKRRYINAMISLDGAQTSEDVAKRILDSDSPQNRSFNLYTFTLTGRLDPQLKQSIADIIEDLREQYFSISVVDQTVPDYDLEYIKEQHKDDIIGRFIEYMEDKLNAAEGDQQQVLRQALYMGLQALLQDH
ncbi:MAG: repair protein SbcD/Mre11 [Clostridiales bacterium]|nr:repair protein SbcD/Mre11 [Clostridiales bacterium]